MRCKERSGKDARERSVTTWKLELPEGLLVTWSVSELTLLTQVRQRHDRWGVGRGSGEKRREGEVGSPGVT